MALLQSGVVIFRLTNAGVDVPRLPKKGNEAPMRASLGRTSAEMPPVRPAVAEKPQACHPDLG